MSQPIVLCQYCDTECKDRVACREFYHYIIYEKIRKLETELCYLNSLLTEYL
jgi:hypothetical protein